MDPHRLPVDAAMQRDPVNTGWTRAIHHGPMSIDQVLARGLAAMLDEDEAERRQRGPVRYVAAPRRPSLFRRLIRR